MRSNYLALTSLLTTSALASALHPAARRQADDAGTKFTSAANDLISDYVPTAVIDEWEAPIMSAAAENSVSGEYSEILYSALQASEKPDWFESAIPSQYEEQYAALTSGVEEIRSAATEAAGGAGEEISSRVESVESQASDVASNVESRATDAASNVESAATDAASNVESKATDVASDVVSGATSVATRIEDGVTSIVSNIVGTETSEGFAARQTAAVGGALMAGLGLVMAL